MSPTSDTANLVSPELLAQLERLELVSRKIFRGRLKGRAAQPTQRAECRVRRLPQLCSRR